MHNPTAAKKGKTLTKASNALENTSPFLLCFSLALTRSAFSIYPSTYLFPTRGHTCRYKLLVVLRRLHFVFSKNKCLFYIFCVGFSDLICTGCKDTPGRQKLDRLLATKCKPSLSLSLTFVCSCLLKLQHGITSNFAMFSQLR